MLVRVGGCPLETLEREGISRNAVLSYAKIGFIVLERRSSALWLSDADADRVFRAERIRRDLGANLIGAALVIEVLERFDR